VAALKAAAASVPVVGFAAGGMVEAVVHEETGLLVEPEDSDALGKAMARFIDNPDLRESFAAAGRERMQDDFSIATMADRHVALYKNILNG
jgi:glycosyltransferase involved in cell wall biosynthesis